MTNGKVVMIADGAYQFFSSYMILSWNLVAHDITR